MSTNGGATEKRGEAKGVGAAGGYGEGCLDGAGGEGDVEDERAWG